MAVFRPFTAIRPVKDKVHLIASRSFVTYRKQQLDFKLATNPYSFIHIIHPGWNKPKKNKPNSAEKFKLVKEKFEDFYNKHYFIQDNIPSFYLYQQETENSRFIGFIGCNAIDDYFNNTIKKHENTLIKREEIFKNYLDICEINAEPVLITYKDNEKITTIISQQSSMPPEYDFTTADGVRHKLWVVSDKQTTKKISNSFSKIDNLYIADGHHRCASSTLLGKEKRTKNSNYSGNEPFNFFMSYLVEESQLKLWEYNRIVKDLNGLTENQFLEKLTESFIVQPTSYFNKPSKINQFALRLANQWYTLNIKPNYCNTNQTDTELLTEYILSPILGIKDLRTDKRIDFVPGKLTEKEIEEKIKSEKFTAGFVLYPTSIQQLKSIADNGLTMPPKSTWIEPKLRSGLTIYKL